MSEISDAIILVVPKKPAASRSHTAGRSTATSLPISWPIYYNVISEPTGKKTVTRRWVVRHSSHHHTMLLPSPTDRLILRCWQDEDFPAFARMNADSRVMEYFPAPLSLPGIRRFLRPHPPEFETERFGLYAPRTSHGRGAAGLYGTSPGHVRRTVVRPGGNRLATAQRHVGQRVCHGSGPKLSSLRQPVENGIHYLFHRLEQSALTTGHATARYDTITGIRPPRTTNGTSSATARPVHDPDERIRRDRTRKPGRKTFDKPTTPSNLRAAAGKNFPAAARPTIPENVRPGPEHRTGNLSNIPTTVVTEYSIGQDRKRVPVPGLPAPNYEPEPLSKIRPCEQPFVIRILSLPPKTGPAEVLTLWPTRPFEAAKKKGRGKIHSLLYRNESPAYSAGAAAGAGC